MSKLYASMNQLHVPRQALAVAKLTVSHAKLLLTIPLFLGVDVIRNLVPVLSVIPEPANILDALAVVINQGVVDGDQALLAETRVGITLQQLQPPLVQCVLVPLDLREEPI